jgi:hypothetical protein
MLPFYSMDFSYHIFHVDDYILNFWLSLAYGHLLIHLHCGL